jgi:hypothetical protein
MSVSHGKSRALKRFLRNKFRTPQKQNRSKPQSGAQAAALDQGPAYSLSTQIPLHYNDTYVRAIPRDPQHAFVYWERPSQKDSKDIKKSEGQGVDRHETVKTQHAPAFQDVKYPQTVLNFQADSTVKSEEHAVEKHETIKIQHTPAFQDVKYPQTILNFQADNTVKNDNENRSHYTNTVAQINPQSDTGSTYVQTPCSGGEIRAEFGIESRDPKKPFEVLTSSPTVHNSEPTVKQITGADVKKGVDTNALVSFSSVNLTQILHKSISGIDHLSSGEFYNIDTEKRS